MINKNYNYIPFLFVLLFSNITNENFANETHKLTDGIHAEQSYDKKYLPSISSITPSKVTLSDGSSWKIVNDEDKIAMKWSANDQTMIRWNNTVSKYYLHNVSHDPSMKDVKNNTILVDLESPSNVNVLTFDHQIISLSDGSCFSYIPFIGKFQIGDRLIFTWNGHDNGQYYPHFLIGYTRSKESENPDWQITGEIQARLITNMTEKK